METEYFSRSEALLGRELMDALRTKRVLLVGVGGVGSWCAETLIRTGLMHLTLMDGDTVQPSNINRQLPATRTTIGLPKVEVLRERLLSISPEAEIVAVNAFYDEQTAIDWTPYDYVIDAIDTVPAKTDLIIRATRARGVKVFSSLGAALRFDPTRVKVGELMEIRGDALGKAVRERMKRLGVKPYKKVRCVYSDEPARTCATRGSLMQVTAVFGCTLASLIIDNLQLTIDN